MIYMVEHLPKIRYLSNDILQRGLHLQRSIKTGPLMIGRRYYGQMKQKYALMVQMVDVGQEDQVN